jgi:hypothetical protein
LEDLLAWHEDHATSQQPGVAMVEPSPLPQDLEDLITSHDDHATSRLLDVATSEPELTTQELGDVLASHEDNVSSQQSGLSMHEPDILSQDLEDVLRWHEDRAIQVIDWQARCEAAEYRNAELEAEFEATKLAQAAPAVIPHEQHL